MQKIASLFVVAETLLISFATSEIFLHDFKLILVPLSLKSQISMAFFTWTTKLWKVQKFVNKRSRKGWKEFWKIKKWKKSENLKEKVAAGIVVFHFNWHFTAFKHGYKEEIYSSLHIHVKNYNFRFTWKLTSSLSAQIWLHIKLFA